MGKRAAGFVIYRQLSSGIEYLLMQTSYGQHHWTPPKGHVDPGENDMQTAVREVEEESGYTIADLKVFEDAKQELQYKVKGKPKTVIYWLAQLVKINKTPRLSEEHQDFKWLQLEEACKVSGYEDMERCLRYFDEYLIRKAIDEDMRST